LTSQTPDDGFHEIQLNGKQLVFLFMAATVVSVVIFLCGVLVGRGVRAERAAVESAAMVEPPVVDATPTTASATSGDNDPRKALPPAAVDDLSYHTRLESTQPVSEQLKPATAQNTAAPGPLVADAPLPTPRPVPVATTPPPAPKPVPSAAATTTAATTTPKTPSAAATTPAAAARPAPPASAPASKAAFVVQLAALNSRGEADAMVKRLAARGYEAYVQAPATGSPSVFRVRVGNYQTRREAESVAARIEKEGQFKPWVAPR
jgi:cell division septation protein DedD